MIRDRIKELRRVPASELRANPKNWRRHPLSQEAALRGVLEEIGFADALICRETSDGLELIDGHLRKEVMEDQTVPVLVVDVNEDEAQKMIMTLDPLGAMAETDQELFGDLLEQIEFADESVQRMLEGLNNGSYHPLLAAQKSDGENQYTQILESPIYSPSGPQPYIHELTDRIIADELIDEIRRADLPSDVEEFLLNAAERHVGFNYESIANYYAHSPPDIQALMARSALVIIDYNQAIENGFVRLKDGIDAAFNEDYPNA